MVWFICRGGRTCSRPCRWDGGGGEEVEHALLACEVRTGVLRGFVWSRGFVSGGKAAGDMLNELPSLYITCDNVE